MKDAPKGKIKIVKAFRELLNDKNFNSITTAETARTAGVTEGLIYKYFKDKRALLYEVLREHYEKFLIQIEKDLLGIEGASKKLKTIITSSLQSYANHRVFARIVMLEARNSEDYFDSSAYKLVQRYNQIILEIIEEGKANGEIREDIDSSYIRHAIFGSIEHACLKGAIFEQTLSSFAISENIYRILFEGITQGTSNN